MANFVQGTLFFDDTLGERGASMSFCHRTPDITLDSALSDLDQLAAAAYRCLGEGATVASSRVSVINIFRDSKVNTYSFSTAQGANVVNSPVTGNVSLDIRCETSNNQVRGIKYLPFPPSVVIQGEKYVPNIPNWIGKQTYDWAMLQFLNLLASKWGIWAIDRSTYPRQQVTTAFVSPDGKTLTVTVPVAFGGTAGLGTTYRLSGGRAKWSGVPITGVFRATQNTTQTLVFENLSLPAGDTYLSGSLTVQPLINSCFPITRAFVEGVVTRKRGNAQGQSRHRGRR